MIQNIVSRADIQELELLLSKLIGLSCWRVSPAYGQSLYIDIGDEVIFFAKQDGEVEKEGEWVLGTCGTTAVISRSDTILFNSNTDWDSSIETIHFLENRKILSIDLDYSNLTLILTLENNFSLSILPTKMDEGIDFPYWELYTPSEMIVEVGPGSVWSYLPINQMR